VAALFLGEALALLIFYIYKELDKELFKKKEE